MKNNLNPAGEGSSRTNRSVVVSREGATLRVERINLSDRERRGLTTGVKSVGSPNGVSPSPNGKPTR